MITLYILLILLLFSIVLAIAFYYSIVISMPRKLEEIIYQLEKLNKKLSKKK